MQKTKFKVSKIAAVGAAFAMMASAFSMNAFAATSSELESGTYEVDSSLSCYVNAMGGVEFAGGGFYKGAKVNVDEDGSKTLTMNFGVGGFTIYGVEAATFVDPNPENPDTTRGVTPGTFGIYDENGNIVTDGVSYTLSGDTTTAKNPSGNYVNYVDSITVPIPYDSDTYNLTFYLNSQVMGMQFCNDNSNATGTPYPAILTIDWDSLSKTKTAAKTASQSATVKYVVEQGSEGGGEGGDDKPDTYIVNIPSVINVDAKTKTGSYSVAAEDFSLSKNAYVKVTTNNNGTLSNGKDSLAFTNELEPGNLTKTGDTLDGTVTVNGNAASAGEYTGTIDFTINYFAE